MPIKIYRCDHVGAPVLDGLPGSLVAVLDACLVTGYGSFNILSVTRIANTATAITSAPTDLATGDVISMTGADQPEYDGEFVVTVIDSSTITFEVQGSPATPATGTITAIRAPAGFNIPITGFNSRVYRSNDSLSRRHYYRIIDDATIDASLAGSGRWASVCGFEKMADMSNGSGRYPSTPLRRYGLAAMKSEADTAVPRTWAVFTDGKTVYAMLSYRSISPSFDVSYFNCWLSFGDMASDDPYAAFVAASNTTSTNAASARNGGIFDGTGSTSPRPQLDTSAVAIARAANGQPTSQVGAGDVGTYPVSILGHGMGQNSIGRDSWIYYPTPTNEVMVSPLKMWTDSYYRGRLPGLYESYHGTGFGGATNFSTFPGDGGRTLMYMCANGSTASSTGGHVLIDITGPWE